MCAGASAAAGAGAGRPGSWAHMVAAATWGRPARPWAMPGGQDPETCNQPSAPGPQRLSAAGSHPPPFLPCSSGPCSPTSPPPFNLRKRLLTPFSYFPSFPYFCFIYPPTDQKNSSLLLIAESSHSSRRETNTGGPSISTSWCCCMTGLERCTVPVNGLLLNSFQMAPSECLIVPC